MFKVDDGLGDWRIAAASRLAAPLGAAFPGGPSYETGTPVHQTELTRTPGGEYLAFLTPSATAMAFSIALSASKKADEIFRELTYTTVLTPYGRGKAVPNEQSGPLFDFFEQCMIAAVFSYQALEVFANHTIARELQEPMEISRGKKRTLYTPAELERKISTSEKLAIVLPKIRNVPTPKGKQVWEGFKVLHETRNATIHLKTQDVKSRPDGSASENPHLFFQFFNVPPREFPKAAEEMIRYFGKEQPHRWLSALVIK